MTDFHNHSVKVRLHDLLLSFRSQQIQDVDAFLCQVFTPDGELVLKFGSNGEGNGQFNAPTGVAVDVNGNIIVADWGNSRIQVQL